MNCFSGRAIRRFLYFVLLIGLYGCNAPAADQDVEVVVPDLAYDIDYVVTPIREERGAWVELRLKQSRHLLRELNMSSERISEITGDGGVHIATDRVIWTPPANGGSLRWFASIDSMRGESYDAYIDADWALFRAEDVMPAARTRTLKGATSVTSLRFVLPGGWSSVTQYAGNNDRYEVANPARRFDRPTGWIVLGKVGVRTDTIAGIRVKVAAPTGHNVRRLDMLALLQWNLPEIARILPSFPHRLTIVSAGEPMWRGGLSAPMSIFLHADRPLLSENATSTLLHETMHVGLGRRAEQGADWIVEGLAEYYGLQVLLRSGTITERRYASAIESQDEWSEQATNLCGRSSSGANTAYAVTLFAQLDRQIQGSTDGQSSLDDVMRALTSASGPISMQELREHITDTMNKVPDILDEDRLPGCNSN